MNAMEVDDAVLKDQSLILNDLELFVEDNDKEPHDQMHEVGDLVEIDIQAAEELFQAKAASVQDPVPNRSFINGSHIEAGSFAQAPLHSFHAEPQGSSSMEFGHGHPPALLFLAGVAMSASMSQAPASEAPISTDSNFALDKMQVISISLDDLVADFYSKESTSGLKLKEVGNSNLLFFAETLHSTNKMLIELIQQKVLHRLIVLDHIARRIDDSPFTTGAGSFSKMGDFHHNKVALNRALCAYLDTHYKDKILVLRHRNPDTKTQYKMVEEEIAHVKEVLRKATKGQGHNTKIFHHEKTDTAMWLNAIHELLLVDAQRVDKELGSQVQPGRLVMFSEHLTQMVNPLVVLLSVHTAIQDIKGIKLDVARNRNAIASLQQQLKVPVPGGILLATHSGFTTPSSSTTQESSATSSPAKNISIGGAHRSRKRAKTSPSKSPTATSDSAYWARIDSKYLTDRAWCQPGMVVGIYPTGAGPPSERALFVCVVTSKPSFLELPQPFAGAEQNPVGLYLRIALAVGVLGRVPVRMEEDVLARFHKAGVSQELFWTARGGRDGNGCVDFAEADHSIDYETAKYIGFADFDEDRFDEFGKLKTDFHDVPGVHVLVAYRAVSETQINARIDNVRQSVSKVKEELTDGLKRSVAATDEKIENLRDEVFGLLPGAQAPNLLSLLLFLLLSSMAFWHLLLQPSLAPVVTSATQDLKFARLFKNGTTLHNSMPSVPSAFLLRPELRANITDAMFELYHKCLAAPELPTPVLVVTAPGGFGKSTEVLSLVQQRAVYEKFGGGVYHLECSYHFGDEKKLLEDLATQMFGSFRSYNDPAELVKAMGHGVALSGEQILVVLDNVGATHIVQSVAKIVGENGVVLVTSRRRTFPDGAVLTEVHELRGKELLFYLEAHKVSVNGSRSANIDTVIARTHGVPLSLTLVSKLHVVLDMPWEEIAARIDSRFGEVGTHDVEEPERLGIESAFQQSTFACIAVSVDMLSAHLKEKFIPLVLLPVGMQVPARVVGAIWGISYPSSHLNSLYDHSLVVYDGDQGVVRLHDYVREYLEYIVRTNATASVTVHVRFEALMSYLFSSASLGPLVAKAKDLNAEIGASYYRHWEYLNNMLHPGANDSVQHLTAFEHVRAHSAQLQQSAPYSLQRCKYAYESSLALRVIGKATSLEMELIDEAMRNVDEAVELHITPVDGSLPQLRACQAELIDKYADLMTSVQGSSMTALQKREKQLQLYLQARELKRDTIGSETREYTRTLNSIGLVTEQILALHKESHGDVETFNVTLLQLANSSYTESLDILSRLIVQKKADWLHVGVVFNNLANMESKLGNYKVVEPYLLQAIAFYRLPLVYLEPSNTCADLIVNAEANIGINCYYMKDYARAKELLTRAREYFVQRFYPSNHVYIVKTTKHLKLIEDLEKSDRGVYN